MTAIDEHGHEDLAGQILGPFNEPAIFTHKPTAPSASYGQPPHDMVNHPPHYTAGPIECIDAIRAALGDEGFIAYCRGNALKYVWRAPRKNAAQDLRKAVWYLNRAADVLEGA